MREDLGSKYDVTTGAVLRGSTTKPLTMFEAREQDGSFLVRV
jgi:nitrite reductase/ring-hydroxylating ferredoxin subunit